MRMKHWFQAKITCPSPGYSIPQGLRQMRQCREATICWIMAERLEVRIHARKGRPPKTLTTVVVRVAVAVVEVVLPLVGVAVLVVVRAKDASLLVVAATAATGEALLTMTSVTPLSGKSSTSLLRVVPVVMLQPRSLGELYCRW